MPVYTHESLNLLRDRIDLVETLSAFIQLQRAGTSYKALCPFHEERTPSFVIQRGQSHYHCFGCGAHGDAIAFLMSHMHMPFQDAVEWLADRFQVTLERQDQPSQENKGPKKALVKEVLEQSCQFYQFLLLNSPEGHEALQYLYHREIDLEFIRSFRIGYAPNKIDALQRFLKGQGYEEAVLEAAGLISEKKRDFFSHRITFPICDAFGSVIGFSARKFHEETFGGKYINSPETVVFKKSHVLFGLHYSRQRISKEKKVLIVEGQIDALRLIHAGFNYTVAGQGTAFGEEHVKELMQLGISRVFLALDADEAGQKACVKIGHLFQKKAIEVAVIKLPTSKDPDAFIREQGAAAFSSLLDKSVDFLPFLIEYYGQSLNLSSPSQKNELVKKVASHIKNWEEPVMVHESLKKLAQLTSVPESMLGISAKSTPEVVISKMGRLGQQAVDFHQALEMDFLRLLILCGPQEAKLLLLAKSNITDDHFKDPHCLKLYTLYLQSIEEGKESDLMTLGSRLETEEEQKLFSELMKKKINGKKAVETMTETIQRILNRQWMEARESIRLKIQSGTCSDIELLELAKAFDEMKKQPPKVQVL